MDNTTYNKQIDAFFSNVPEDVRNDWLYASARNNGWPPKGPFWNAVLLHRDISFWQETKWLKETVDLESSLWASGTLEAISQMAEGFSGNTSSLFSSKVERQRVLNPIRYIFKTGKIPPTIALLAVRGGFEVVDGHHRLLAFFQARNVLNVMKQLEDEGRLQELATFHSGFKNEWEIENLATVPTKHEVWVAHDCVT